MSENKQLNVMPAVSADEPASESQVKMLKEIGKYKDGMTKDEASQVISAYIQETSIPCGIHLFRINNIEEAMKGSTIMTDSNNNPGLRITFRNKPDPAYGNIAGKISDLFYYPATVTNPCKSDFKLRNLKKALGVKPEESQNIETLKSLKFWGIVQDVRHIDEQGNPILSNGKPVVTKQLLAEYYAGSNPCPAIEGDPKGNNGVPGGKFVSTRVDKAKESSSSTSSESAPAAAASTSAEGWD